MLKFDPAAGSDDTSRAQSALTFSDLDVFKDLADV